VTPRYFNPLDRVNLGKSVAEAVLESQSARLREIEPFSGAGLYIIFYSGDFEPYQRLSSQNQPPNQLRFPIYIGKAIPKGGRKGLDATPENIGPVLFQRLSEHLRSLEQASNLEAEDFWVRCLIVDDIWIPLGESVLIRHFRPLWNSAVDGFGNHDPGKGRYVGARPDWDAIHPGRAWAEKCAPAKRTLEEILFRIDQYFRAPDRFEILGQPDERETQ
jgi:Eco29kI restriction endonuclease